MKKTFQFLMLLLSTGFAQAQTSYTIFDEVVFYDGYAGTVEEPVPPGITRISNAVYTTKLSNEMVQNLSLGKLSMDVTIGALCDNYDRIGDVYLAFVDKGETEYTQSEVMRIEIARFITPFMNKNINPTEVPYHYQLDNVSEIFKDQSLLNEFDIWVELEVFGVPYAANTQVAGCAGRNDVFEGTLVFNVEEGSTEYPDENFLLPLSTKEDLNNYNSTDVPGETTKIMNFTLDEPIENAVLYFIVSNHGANTNGEEYERRKHFLYLDDELIHQYKPGGKSCEPWRQFNTQGNGIYSASPRPLRMWLSFNNWCPGDAIPNREIQLGTLSAGEHTLVLDVPDAVFYNDEGYFPVSVYIQNRQSGQTIYPDPNLLTLDNQQGTSATVSWVENGETNDWEVLWGRRNLYAEVNDTYQTVSESPTATKNDLTPNWYYEIFVRSKYGDASSMWVGPVYTDRILSTSDEMDSSLSLYPNPATNFVNIDSKKPIEKVAVFSMDGKLVLTDNSSQISVSQLPSGNYTFIIYFENGKSEVRKVIKK